ncbi:MAG: LutC/YkgG family protein [Tumebacillaceae bacterium]
MSQGNENIIEDLQTRSKQQQGGFLTRVAKRLKRTTESDAPVHPFRGAPDVWQSYELTEEERVLTFMKNWNQLGGVVKRFARPDALVKYVCQVANMMEAKYALSWDHPLLEALQIEACLPGVEMTVWRERSEEQLLAKAAGADFGIVVADYAIAHTGTVVTVSAPQRGRSVSLLPTAFLAIIRAETIKTRMGEVMAALKEQFGTQLPAGVHFITGPSRSADIENDLTIGVHGPGIVYALILD